MRYVAGLGFPVPRLYRADGADLVMDRVDGPTMASALLAGTLPIPEAATQLADLHHRLHELPPRLSTDSAVACCTWICTRRTSCSVPEGRWSSTGATPGKDRPGTVGGDCRAGAVDHTHAWAVPAQALLAAFLRRVGGSPLQVLDHAVAIRKADPGLGPDGGPARRGGTLVTHCG